MNRNRLSISSALLSSLLVSVVALGACSMTPMAPATTAMTARLSGAGEVPSVTSAGIGTADVTLNPSGNLLTWTVTYSGLTGPVTGGHFHGPALAGQNAGVVVPFAAGLVSPITGSATLTPTQVADLSAGKWYVNLHTAANPGGEIRGQVTVRP